MPFIIKTVIAFALFTIGFGSGVLIAEPPLGVTDPVTAPYGSYTSFRDMQHDIWLYVAPSTPTTLVVKPVYKHGECDWLPAMALKAGWPVDQLGKLKQIALRESGCCPNRAGGDMVDKDCNITGVAEWTHRSDSGLLQINGVHWLPTHKEYAGLICKQISICTQPPLLDAFTNLRAALLIYSRVGWSAWDICNRTKSCK